MARSRCRAPDTYLLTTPKVVRRRCASCRTRPSLLPSSALPTARSIESPRPACRRLSAQSSACRLVDVRSIMQRSPLELPVLYAPTVLFLTNSSGTCQGAVVRATHHATPACSCLLSQERTCARQALQPRAPAGAGPARGAWPWTSARACGGWCCPAASGALAWRRWAWAGRACCRPPAPGLGGGTPPSRSACRCLRRRLPGRR